MIGTISAKLFCVCNVQHDLCVPSKTTANLGLFIAKGHGQSGTNQSWCFVGKWDKKLSMYFYLPIVVVQARNVFLF